VNNLIYFEILNLKNIEKMKFNINERNNYDYEQDKDFITSRDKYSKTYIKSNSTIMRISILEDRTKSLEKMLRLFEERLNIKEEEKLNEIKTIESNNEIINKLNKKIKNLEKKLNEFEIEKKKSDEDNNNKIIELNNKIKNLEDKLKTNNNEKNMNSNNDINQNNNINNNDITTEEENYKLILTDINELINNNNDEIIKIIDDKIYNANIDIESKINELLNLIHDMNKILEENENQINLIGNNFNKYQNDNIDIIQMISIHDEKIKNIDFLNNEMQKIKVKMNNLDSYLEDKNEEDKFTNQFLNSVRIK